MKTTKRCFMVTLLVSIIFISCDVKNKKRFHSSNYTRKEAKR